MSHPKSVVQGRTWLARRVQPLSTIAKYAATFVAALLAVFALQQSAWANPTDSERRVLLVVSSHGATGENERPGFEMDELAQAWAVFTDNGFAVDIASPAGGPVVADSYNAEKPYNARLLGDVVARQALESTLRLSDIRERSYTAIMVIGGKGAMFDLPTDAALKSLLLATYGRGGVIGAVCHGPAVFMNLQLADGTSLIRGRRITGFTNAEERLFGERWMPVFPVLLEDGLRGAGGEFSAGPMMLSHVVTDGRLVTGQNPYSTAATAEAMIRAMGLTPAARTPWQDERSMALITRAIAGELDWARSALAEQRDLYEVPLIAIWGYYRSQEPGLDQVARRQALSIMELAQPYFPEPQLAAAIAATRAELGQEARP